MSSPLPNSPFRVLDSSERQGETQRDASAAAADTSDETEVGTRDGPDGTGFEVEDAPSIELPFGAEIEREIEAELAEDEAQRRGGRAAGAPPYVPPSFDSMTEGELRTLWKERFGEAPATITRADRTLADGTMRTRRAVLIDRFRGKDNEGAGPPPLASTESPHAASETPPASESHQACSREAE